MATLDETKRINDTLELKYHSSAKPGSHVRREIASATDLARSIARAAHDELWKKKMSLKTGTIVDDVLRAHFHYHQGGQETHLDMIVRVMQLTSQGLFSSIRISDVWGGGRQTSDEGYVQLKAGYVKGSPNALGSIHLEFSLLSTYSQTAIARIIVHEATHRFADTEDHAYAHDPAYNTLSPALACDNADTFAYAAISIYKKKITTWQTLRDKGAH